MIALFPLNYCLSLYFDGYNWIASVATLGVGLAQVAFSLILAGQCSARKSKSVSSFK